MEIKNIQKRNEDAKHIMISMRITQEVSNWLRENNISPTGLFNEAVKDVEKQLKEDPSLID